MFKVSQKEFLGFVMKFNRGDFPNQRFGQAFYNEFMPHHLIPNVYETIELNELFYGEDDKTVMNLIVSKYVRWED